MLRENKETVLVFVFVHFKTPLPDQEGPTAGSMSTFELMSSKDLAYQMTMFDWELFSCVHEVSCSPLSTLNVAKTFVLASESIHFQQFCFFTDCC